MGAAHTADNCNSSMFGRWKGVRVCEAAEQLGHGLLLFMSAFTGLSWLALAVYWPWQDYGRQKTIRDRRYRSWIVVQRLRHVIANALACSMDRYASKKF